MPCEITMNLITYLPKERNWGPMTTALWNLERWRRILKYSECFLMLSEFIKMMLLVPINELGWNDEGNDEIRYIFSYYGIILYYQILMLFIYRLLRSEILLASVLWEDNESINKAKNILQQHLSNGTAIPPNLREVCKFC